MGLSNFAKKIRLWPENIFNLKTLVPFFVLVELASFLAYCHSWVNVSIFGLIVLTALFLSLKKPIFGLYIVFAELILSSKGYFFFLDLGDFAMSLRIALFGIVFLVWIIKFFQAWSAQYRQTKIVWQIPAGFLKIWQHKIGRGYLLLGIVIVWGIVWGLIQKNSLTNVFLDFNNWLYFLLIIPFVDWFDKKSQLNNFLQLLFAGTIVLFIETILISYIYSHQYPALMIALFRWTTDFGIGEISQYMLGFYRVFIQSQVFVLATFFISLALLLIQKFQQGKSLWSKYLFIFICAGTTLLISFSRSYWVGIFVGVIALLIILKIKFNFRFSQIFKSLGLLIIIAIFNFVLVFGVINLPPQKQPLNLAYLFGNRLLQGGAAGQSRISQLEPLKQEILKSPLIGHGFGQTITYQSFDPRQMTEANPEGWYTTYAFEWGYLDMILKFGIVGLLIYLFLIFNVVRLTWTKIKTSLFEKQNDKAGLIFGLVLGLTAIVVTHIFSPYLNHPLGIGYLIFLNSILFVI
ncbi:MAG: O-antigen ligase family protein [Patescibacteria group bacterium]